MSKIKGRYELKHYINYCDVLQLRARLPFVASLDRNCGTENGYRIRSLYFDNYNDKALKEKIDGVNEREKFRLRLYDNDTSFKRLIEGDRGQDYSRILQSFINGITHCGRDKLVVVKQILKDNIVRIEVIDHGEGISESNLPYIWDRYYKVDKKYKRPIMGTGLGLSIVKNIIEMHDGEYGVESELGKGSIFWFQLIR